jgi:hypothetical protein
MRRLLVVWLVLVAAVAFADNAALNDAAKSWWAALPDCDDVTGKLEYDSATESFVCRTDAGGGGGGDNTFVGGAATVDADFIDTAEIDVVLNGAPAPDTIAMNLINGSIADARLASNYSGIGACAANTFCSTLNDAAAPTCTQPSFANLSGTASDAQVDGSLEANELVLVGEVDGAASANVIDDGVTVDAWVLGASTATTPAANDNDTSLGTSAFVQSEIDDGDNLTDNCIVENDATPIPDSCVGDGVDAGTAIGPRSGSFFAQGNDCGAATNYMGFDTVSCNAAEGTADTTLTLDSDITVVFMSCVDFNDASCTWRATLRKNLASPGAPDFQCTGANVQTCGDTGSTTFSTGDEIAFLIEDTAANCAATVTFQCTVYFTW